MNNTVNSKSNSGLVNPYNRRDSGRARPKMPIESYGPMSAVVVALLLIIIGFATTGHAQVNPRENGYAVAPDSWLLEKVGKPWWYQSRPSPNPVELKRRSPTAAERSVVDQAVDLMATRPARAFVLLDGDTVVHEQYKAPANSESVLFGLSMGKTVTAMAVGQAICSGKLKLETMASELVTEVSGKALGNATVRDLLRMSSGTTAASDAAGAIWTQQEAVAWGRGELNLLDLITQDRNAKAAHGVFSDYLPGEVFAYKSTDPTLLAVMVSRASGMPWSQWLQLNVLDRMGAAYPGLYVQDKQQNGMSEAGMRLRLEDWMRFAVWVKRSSKESGCFGDFVRSAQTMQIKNGTGPNGRKFGSQFAGYGYFTWTDNATAPNTAWAWGYGGQKIGWHRDSDRMVIVFSNVASWMEDVYRVARDWNKIPSTGKQTSTTSRTTTAVAQGPTAAAGATPVSSDSWKAPLSGQIEYQNITPPYRWEYTRRKMQNTKPTIAFGILLPLKSSTARAPAVVFSSGREAVNKAEL